VTWGQNKTNKCCVCVKSVVGLYVFIVCGVQCVFVVVCVISMERELECISGVAIKIPSKTVLEWIGQKYGVHMVGPYGCGDVHQLVYLVKDLFGDHNHHGNRYNTVALTENDGESHILIFPRDVHTNHFSGDKPLSNNPHHNVAYTPVPTEFDLREFENDMKKSLCDEFELNRYPLFIAQQICMN
jgi:hypothetical protein